VPTEWEQGELPVQEYHRVALREKVLGGRGAACASGEVVNEAHRLVLQRDRGAARGQQHYAPGVSVVVGYEGVCLRRVLWQRGGWWVAGEVVGFGG